MKKICLFCFVFCFLVLFNCIPGHATSIAIPFSDVIGLYTTFGSIANGASIDMSDFDSVEDYINFIARAQRGENPELPYAAQQRASATISRELINKMASMALNGAIDLSDQDNLIITYNKSAIKSFTNGSKYWWKNYIATNNDTPVVNPDINYISYLNRINSQNSNDSSTFWFYNFPTTMNQVILYSNPITSYSWVTYSNYQFTTQTNSFSTPYMMPCNIIDINIISNNDVYSYSYSGTSYGKFVTNNSSLFWSYGFLEYPGTINGLGSSSLNPAGIGFNFSYSGSLSQVLNHIALHFKNVNIYVDGDLWSLAGDIPVSNPPVLSPDLVGVGDLPDDTYDVFLPDTDLGIDLGGFLGWLKEKFDNNDLVLGLDDLIEDAPDIVVENDQTRAITDSDVGIIDEALEDTDTNNDNDNDNYDPVFPAPLPPILPISNPTPRQTTVLSEIIDATNTVVPDELMTLIWSTFGLLITGGLIFILHK